MGKGDKKTTKGKISKGTYGVSRLRSANKKKLTKETKPPKAEK